MQKPLKKSVISVTVSVMAFLLLLSLTFIASAASAYYYDDFEDAGIVADSWGIDANTTTTYYDSPSHSLNVSSFEQYTITDGPYVNYTVQFDVLHETLYSDGESNMTSGTFFNVGDESGYQVIALRTFNNGSSYGCLSIAATQETYENYTFVFNEQVEDWTTFRIDVSMEAAEPDGYIGNVTLMLEQGTALTLTDILIDEMPHYLTFTPYNVDQETAIPTIVDDFYFGNDVPEDWNPYVAPSASPSPTATAHLGGGFSQGEFNDPTPTVDPFFNNQPSASPSFAPFESSTKLTSDQLPLLIVSAVVACAVIGCVVWLKTRR